MESKLLYWITQKPAEYDKLHKKSEIRRSENQAEQFAKLRIVDKCHQSLTGGCLQKGIESDKDNTTRFFIISKKVAKTYDNMKTTIVFSTQPKSKVLYNCLKGFAKNNINFTKFVSRPLRGVKWEYLFYLDFCGGIEDKDVKEALRELKEHTKFTYILGSYVNQNINNE